MCSKRVRYKHLKNVLSQNETDSVLSNLTSLPDLKTCCRSDWSWGGKALKRTIMSKNLSLKFLLRGSIPGFFIAIIPLDPKKRHLKK